MKKLIALMMCAMLLLTGCTAMTAEGPGTGFQIGDLVINSASGETLDLTGLSIAFETAETDTSVGCRAHISADGQEDADIIWAVVGQYLYLSMPGTEGINSYALDMSKVGQALSDAFDTIGGAISGIIPAIFPGTGEGVDETPPSEDAVPEMTDEELEAALAELEAALAELEEEGYAPEVDVPEVNEEELSSKLEEILSRCMTQDTVEIDGETFGVVTLHIADENMAELLEMIIMDEASGTTAGQALAANGITVALDGVITGNESFSKFDIDITPSFYTADETIAFEVDIDHMAGGNSTTVSLSPMQDGQSVGGLSMSFASTVVDDASWLPAELSEDTVILTEMPLEQVKEVLAEGFDDYITQFQTIAGNVAEANQAG